jgi:hypothetical protein
VDRLLERSRPLYGQLVLAALLLSALSTSVYFVTHHGGIHPHGDRGGPVSVLSWLLPDALLLGRRSLQACAGLLVVGVGLWGAGRWVPWSGWLTAISFNGVVALYLESSSQVTHVAHLTGQMLLVYALWYQVCAADIRSARREGRFWSTALYPRWVYSLGVLVVGLFYGLSGVSKLLESGVDWANGTSLQLWASLWGNPDSWWTQLILRNRRFAALLQATALVGETAALPAIVWPRLRPLVGTLLIGFHIGQIAVFGWGFHANMAIIALVFLPFHAWLSRPPRERLPRVCPGHPPEPLAAPACLPPGR